MNTILLHPEPLSLPTHYTWKTHWYHCDTESCLMSSILPCHIQSKIISNNRSNYKYYFLGLFLLYLVYYTTIVGWIYVPTLTCNGQQTYTCTYQSPETCDQLYMLVNNDKTYQCKWVNFIDGCIPETTQTCIRQEIMYGNIAVIASSFGIFSMVYLFVKVQFRETYQTINNIKQNKWTDCFISMFCPICSDAQIYREETMKHDDYISGQFITV
jgi:hypothetical protein